MWRPSEPAPPPTARLQCIPPHRICPGRTCPPFSVCFFKSATACLFPPSSSFFCQLKPCSATFAGSSLAGFSLDQLLGFLSGRNRCGPLWGRLRPGELLWNCRPIGSQASLPSLFSAPPPHPDLPALLTHPNFPGLPGEGLRTFRDGTPPPVSLGWALPLLLKDRAASPLREPLTTLSHSQGPQRRGHSFIPPCMCSSHTVISLSCPRTGAWARSSLGSMAWVKCSPFLLLGTAAGRRGVGGSLPQPFSFLLPPVPRCPGWLLHREPAPLSSGLGGSYPLLPMGRCLRPPRSCPSSAQSQVDWNCAKPQNFRASPELRLWGKERFCICSSQGPGPWESLGGSPGGRGEKSLKVALA